MYRRPPAWAAAHEERSLTTDDLVRAGQLLDQRVRITFTDGQQVIARLVSVTTDAGGSQHLLYDAVEWSALPHIDIGSGAFYAGGEEIVSLLPAPSGPQKS